jgi:hypothetical protein
LRFPTPVNSASIAFVSRDVGRLHPPRGLTPPRGGRAASRARRDAGAGQPDRQETRETRATLMAAGQRGGGRAALLDAT